MTRLLRGGSAVLAALLLLSASPAAAQDPPSISRLAGETRVDTAIAISVDGYADGEAEAVILAREDVFADALAGGPLAAQRRGPLLLTRSDQLAPVVEAEIQRVLPEGETVYLLGGEVALDESVAARVTELGYEVMRLEGDTRYTTALAIAEAAAPDPGFITIATGNDFPDALIAGSLASAFAGGIVVLTDADRLPAPVAAYLETHSDVDKTTVGPAAAVAFPSVFNVNGVDAAERSVVAAEIFYERIEPTAVGLASVERFPDGLTAAAHAFAAGPLPLLLTPGDALPSGHVEYVQGLAAADVSYVYGGNLAIGESVLDQLRAALQG